MLAPIELPSEFVQWNKKWGSPFGRRFRPGPVFHRVRMPAVRLIGPFAFQGNSVTRTFEYPWTYAQLATKPEARLLEIGGALSGLQFVLSKEGAEVHNVDPLLDYGSGPFAESTLAEHAQINKRYGTNVILHQSTLQECRELEPGFDANYSVSTLEHVATDDIASTLGQVNRLLRPGGLFILTIDLFLNLIPFCAREVNSYGRNVSVAWIEDLLGFKMISGNTSELYGFPEFDSDRILSNLECYMMSGPQMAQVVSWRKPLPAAVKS